MVTIRVVLILAVHGEAAASGLVDSFRVVFADVAIEPGCAHPDLDWLDRCAVAAAVTERGPVHFACPVSRVDPWPIGSAPAPDTAPAFHVAGTTVPIPPPYGYALASSLPSGPTAPWVRLVFAHKGAAVLHHVQARCMGDHVVFADGSCRTCEDIVGWKPVRY